MSKKKSLGSSPIGYNSTSGAMGFIPTIEGDTNTDNVVSGANNRTGKKIDNTVDGPSTEKAEKKTVSYYLEIGLIGKVKSIAKDKEICYSALVSQILRRGLPKKKNDNRQESDFT